MAEKIKVARVSPNQWTNLNTLFGFATGTAFQIQNHSGAVMLQESDTTPAVDAEGDTLTGIDRNYAVADIVAGSDDIWAKPVGNYSCKLSAKEV